MAPVLPKFAKNAMRLFTNRNKEETNNFAEDKRPVNGALSWEQDHNLETTDVTKMSLRIPINWKVSAHDFEIKNYSGVIPVLEELRRKQIFHLKGMPNLRFSLNLYFSDINKAYSVRVIPEYIRAALSIDLKYAFVAWEKQAYHLAKSPEFNFHTAPLTYFDFMKYSNFLSQWGYVTVHCMIHIQAEVSSTFIPNGEGDPSTRIDIGCELGKRSSSTIDEDFKIALLDTEATGFLRDHAYSGDIQKLNTEIAMKLIDNGAKNCIPQIVFLCMSYLERNLTAKNVLDILKIAQTNKIERLKNACVDFLSTKCKVVRD